MKTEELYEVTEKHMVFQTKNFYIRLRITKQSWWFNYDICWWSPTNDFNIKFWAKYNFASLEEAFKDAFNDIDSNFKLITIEQKWKYS